MGENIEIKAWARDEAAQRAVAARLAGTEPTLIVQTDTFFHVPSGRLKLRAFEDGTGELIQYHRADRTEAARSSYTIVEVPATTAMRQALTAALGVLGIVRKQRHLYLIGQTRVHFDRVEGLGDFIELEVVLEPGQDDARGVAIAENLMAQLGICDDDLVDRAYVDLSAG